MAAKIWNFSHLWPLPGLSFKFGTNLIQNYWYMAISKKIQDGFQKPRWPPKFDTNLTQMTEIWQFLWKSKMASKIKDGRQGLKIFSCVKSFTPTRLKFKIWHQSDSKWLVYGHFKKIQDGFQSKIWKFSYMSHLWPITGLSLKLGTNLTQNY